MVMVIIVKLYYSKVIMCLLLASGLFVDNLQRKKALQAIYTILSMYEYIK